MALPPLADKARLLSLPSITDESRAVLAIATASAMFRSAVRHAVSLVEGDVTEVTLIEATWPSGDVTVDPLEYQVRKQYGIVRRWAGWAADVEFRVTYSHGYAEIPEDIAAVVLEAARIGYPLVSLPGRVTGAALGPQSLTFGAGAGSEPGTAGSSEWDRVVADYRLNAGDRP